jgi:hypothetical protein
MTEIPDVPAGVDPARPNPMRVSDYLLGGTNNFPVDREAAERLKAAVPDIVDALWANRGFHGRAAMWLADRGIRQFIDIGSGLPSQNNTHDAVHRVAPAARGVRRPRPDGRRVLPPAAGRRRYDGGGDG